MIMHGWYEGDGKCGTNPHTWQAIQSRYGGDGFVCLNCTETWLPTPEVLYWHGCTGTPIPEGNPRALYDDSPKAALIWRG